MTQAAVLEHTRQPLHMTEVALQAPGPGEVKIELGATGVCHSDIAVYTAELPGPLPLVLGHEGAGTVVELGEGVDSVALGDRVVLSWLAQCGSCFACVHDQPYLCETARTSFLSHALADGTTRLSVDDHPIHQFCGLGTFARHCVVPAGAAIPVPDTIPMASAALIGCGVLTGFGAAVNTADLRGGETVAVIGCGGVGLNAVQGARIAGAATIIAIDVHTERLELAQQLGATHAVPAGPEVVKQVRALTGRRGVDVAIEVAGRQETVRDAIAMTRRGGQTVLVGAGPDAVTVDVPAFSGLVMTGKTIKGSLYGSADVRRDVPRLVELYERGLLKLDELVTQTFAFDEVNEAVQYCASEQGARSVVVFA